MIIRYGITGNYYIYSENEEEIKKVLNAINKSLSSIYYNKKYKVYVARIKSKAHKIALKAYTVSR